MDEGQNKGKPRAGAAGKYFGCVQGVPDYIPDKEIIYQTKRGKKDEQEKSIDIDKTETSRTGKAADERGRFYRDADRDTSSRLSDGIRQLE